ncbi:MAG: PEGA domain-containing protein [Planctomycetota bacterium]|jgi:hypothetical protein
MSRLAILLMIPLLGGCCYLKVNTIPSGADISVNEVYVGKSPLETKVWFWQTFSSKEITAVKEGYNAGKAELGFWEVFFWIWGTTKERKIELDSVKPVQTKPEVKLPEKPRVSMKFHDADVKVVIQLLAVQTGTNIVIAPEIVGKVNCDLKNVPWDKALDSIVGTLGYIVVRDDGNIFRVTTRAGAVKNPGSQTESVGKTDKDGAK